MLKTWFTRADNITEPFVRGTTVPCNLHPLVERNFRSWPNPRSFGLSPATKVLRYVVVLLIDAKCRYSLPIDLHRTLLSHLEQSILQGANAPFDTLFDFYRTLCQGWSQHIVAAPGKPIATQAYVDLIAHVSSLAQSALAVTLGSSSAILSFFETVVDFALDAVSKRILLPILGPPPQVIYLLLMSSSLSDISRTCSVVLVYKKALEKKANRTNEEAEAVNAYLMDVCNLLWRSRALELASNANPSAKGCLCPAEVSMELQTYLSGLYQDYHVQTMFDSSHNPVIASLSQSAFAALQDDAEASKGEPMERLAGPVTARSLDVLKAKGGMEIEWQQCRISMLNWMEARGVDGIKKLLAGTIRNLMNP
jgi:centromere protein I